MRILPIAITAFGLLSSAAVAQTQNNMTTFGLIPNGAFNQCISADGATPPVATAKVTRGNLNDTLAITVTGLKPNLQFDLFTVQRSPFLADETKDPAFTGTFGLAWYQSDLDADGTGVATLVIPLRSILLDQIFGFDGDIDPTTNKAILAPTNTYHVGF
jgi:hypothetical protein